MDVTTIPFNEIIWDEDGDCLNHVSQGTQDNVIPHLRSKWIEEYKDILSGVPEQLPPLREINHKITLIDEEKRYHYYMPRCPNVLKTQLSDKLGRYTRSNWWIQTTVPQAAPMLCIPKKNGTIRTIVDYRQRNENTVKDVTPFPDQDHIRADVASHRYRSKIDMSDAYEQIRNLLEDVPKTAFATIFGTFVSNVMMQGDCNVPATFQPIMTLIFRDIIGHFVHVYLDNIFIFSDYIEEHESHLRVVFDRLRQQKFFLKAEKCELYADSMDCLGHVIDDRGIHADMDKMSKIRDWRTPRTFHDV